MVCFQQESFAKALIFPGKGGKADTFLQDTSQSTADGACTLPEPGLGWQLPWEKLYHSLISSEHNLMMVSKTSQLLSLLPLRLQAFQWECWKVWPFFFSSSFSKAIPDLFCAVILRYSESKILSSAAGSMFGICIDLCHVFLSSKTTGM